jgi:hypothetical protein
VTVERWGADLYGDPCRGCGYGWSLTPQDAIRLVEELPNRFGRLLSDCTGRERHPDLDWDPTGYVCHVVDNLRIWAEGLAAGNQLPEEVSIPGYDPDLLARARRYHQVVPAAALWSLDRAVAAWSDSVTAALARGVVLRHARRGIQRAQDIARNNAHDAYHHAWDIERILQFAAQNSR